MSQGERHPTDYEHTPDLQFRLTVNLGKTGTMLIQHSLMTRYALARMKQAIVEFEELLSYIEANANAPGMTTVEVAYDHMVQKNKSQDIEITKRLEYFTDDRNPNNLFAL